ncbi:MAG: diguanylate cyclase [Peptostreptococcaceae bacterium]
MTLKNNKLLKSTILIILILLSSVILLISINKYNKIDKSYSANIIDIIDKDEELLVSKNELQNYEKEINKELKSRLKENKSKFKIKESYYAIGAIKYLQNNSTESIYYLNKALEYGEIDSSNKDIIELDMKIYSALSSNYIMQKNIEQSQYFFEQAKTIALKNNKKERLCDIYYAKAKSIASSGYNINESIDLMRKSLEYADLEHHNIRNYLYLSTLYKLTEEFDLALEYVINALDISLKLNNNIYINRCVISLGEIYYTQKNYSKTIYIYESYFTEHKLLDNENKLTVYGYLAECYAKEGNYQNYKMYRDKYIDLANEVNDTKGLVWIYTVCAELEIEFSNLNNAKTYLGKAQYLYNKNKNDVYSNTDVMIGFAKSKIDYFENKNYTKVLKRYETILDELDSRGIKSDINSVIREEVLDISLENDDFKTFKKYINKVEDYNKKESSQAYTDSIYAGINNTLEGKKLFREKIKTFVLLILSIVSIYELINSKIKNKKINRLNLQLKEINTLDPLTNLYNRGYLIEQLRELKNKGKVTFIMIDIDYFKLYNDNYGHIKGDEVLIQVANIIKSVFKDGMVFRYGGEEFSVISNDSKEDIIKNIEELRLKLYKENIVHEHSKVSDRITLSIGIASKKVSTEEDIPELTKLADENLYKSKERGRNTYT